MNVRSIKTKKFYPEKSILEDIFPYLRGVSDGDVVAISSKIISICQKRYVPLDTVDKDQIVHAAAEKVLKPAKDNTSHMELTLTDGLLIESAGVDQSNGNGYYILMPETPYAVAKLLWETTRKINKIRQVGIIITDSHSVPAQRGAVGLCVCAYGFKPIRNYEGKKDALGNELHGSVANLSEALAAAAVIEMGEGGETTPMAVISNLKNIVFYKKGISILRQRNYLYISPEKDVYGRLLEATLWQSTNKG